MSLSTRLLRYGYTLLLSLALPFLVLRLWYKGRNNVAYRQRLLERWGCFKAPLKTGGVWIHAVSVGETMAAIPLIRAFQKAYPQMPITLTTTTPTGSHIVRTVLKEAVFHVYFPFDLPFCINAFLRKTKPEFCVLMEKELWFNHLVVCYQKHIPVFLANATLSLRSFKRYRFFSLLTKEVLNYLTRVFAQSELDQNRFLALGLNKTKIEVAGNVKFDIHLSAEIIQHGKLYRKTFEHRPVLIAASTHPGEEELVLSMFKAILNSCESALLILVPRHPERAKALSALLEAVSYSFVTRSSQQPVLDSIQVLLVDTLGELILLYSASDIAFVGGSLVPIGGHNTLEPAALGIPILVGPYTDNYVAITRFLKEAGGLVQKEDPVSLARAAIDWFLNPIERQSAGEACKQVVLENQGAVQKTLKGILDPAL